VSFCCGSRSTGRIAAAAYNGAVGWHLVNKPKEQSVNLQNDLFGWTFLELLSYAWEQPAQPISHDIVSMSREDCRSLVSLLLQHCGRQAICPRRSTSPLDVVI
jgi:hypothetical protein